MSSPSNPQPAPSPTLPSQTSHRHTLLTFWSIPPGSTVLEIGCGQGDTTTVLAEAVGQNGHIDAYDPGSPDYGSPWTLGQAQAHILNGPFGEKITFTRQIPKGKEYDYIVLAHCIYYFSTTSVLPSLLASLPPSKYLCVAEWSLRSSTLSSVPHVLTALLRSFLETKREKESEGNIRTVLSPKQICEVVVGKGWVKEKEEIKRTEEGMQDGYWEVRDVLREKDEILTGDGMVLSEGERTVIGAMVGAIELGVEGLEGGVEGMRCMDVWMGRFRREG